MTREEAINKVRQMDFSREMMDIFEALAPELKESEDERIRKNLIELLLDAPAQDIVSHHLDLSKALILLERQKEQKSVQWSKEDEQIIERIIETIQEYAIKTGQIDKKTYGTKEPLISYIRFLRSIRPQPHWKPSYEQMESLRMAVNKLAKTDVADSVRLSIMYDNLKRTNVS